MDAVDILKVCIRRWYVMLPILLGASGVSYQLVQSQEPSYTAAASYGLVQSRLTADDDLNLNPLGSAGDVLVGEALEAQLNSGETQTKLGEGGDSRGWGPGDVRNNRYYDVRVPQFESTFEVRAWGEDEGEVRAVVERVIAAAPDLADELQARAGVPPTQRWQPFVLAPVQVAELPSTGWLKMVLAVMGVAVLTGAAWCIVVDRGVRWRRAGRERSLRVDDEPPVEPDDPVPGRLSAPARGEAVGDANRPRLATHATDGSGKPRGAAQQSTSEARRTSGKVKRRGTATGPGSTVRTPAGQR